MLYVLAVIILGLRFGPFPAVLGAVLSFFSFNYFLTEPRYTLNVIHDEELATLVFLFLIALACGPAASRIRSQFEQLRIANRRSETLRRLGEQLSLVDSPDAVWRAVANELSLVFDCECYVLAPDDNGELAPVPDANGVVPEDVFRIARDLYGRGFSTDGLTGNPGSGHWSVFPVNEGGVCRAYVVLGYSSHVSAQRGEEEQLIAAMLKQASNTWRRVMLAAELEDMRVKSEIEQLRSALLSSVSHDLKSPLAAMMGSAESLRYLDKKLQPEDRVELLDTIMAESRRLESYIQNLLDMTRLSYGELQIDRDWTAITDLIGSALSRLKRYYPDFKSNLNLQNTPPLLYVHAALIEQALFNVLENAAKFTPGDEIVDISVFTEDAQCVVAIDDKGPGIPGSLRERIFDMFYIVTEGDQKSKGTGMGLAICRGMIGAHGGTVFVADQPYGRGARVIIKLPLAERGTVRDEIGKVSPATP